MLRKLLFHLAGSILLAAAPPALPAPLADLDARFHEAYSAARDQAGARTGPVLVVSGDSLQLFRDRKVVAEATVRPVLYHQLKAVAHAPLTLRLLARPWLGRPLDGEGEQALRALRTRLQAALDGLDPLFPEAAMRLRQRAILQATLDHLDGILAARRVEGKGLDRFTASLRGPIQANLQAAAALELEALAGTIPAWGRAGLTGAPGTLKVVVIGSHMARDREVSWQYFARLLGQDCAGGRLVFAEGLWDPQDALALLASHAVDRDLGAALFGDPRRMHRDVLGDAAKKWLEAHPGAR